MKNDDEPGTLSVSPIGVLHTPFVDRASAPRQSAAARGVAGTIELFKDPRFEHALEDLERFRYIWVLFWFHLNEGWSAKVRPPRSEERRGLFATRSPYRPNPIGMSALRLERIEGLTLHVLDVDMLDGTPVLDIKPYLPYTDAIVDAGHGWLDDPGSGFGEERPRDPRATQEIRLSDLARRQLVFLAERFSLDLEPRIRDALALGATPHPYRRIKKDADGYVLAVRDFRAHFRIEDGVVVVLRLQSGYRPSQLFGPSAPELDAHRAFVEKFGADGNRDAP